MTAKHDPHEPCKQRDTGIPLLGATEWGTNICLFYETLDDLLKPTASFFKSGLHKHERCIWAVSHPVTIKIATEALRAQIPHIEELLRSGAIRITDKEKWDVRPDEFNLQRITAKWSDEMEVAERQGFDGLRLSGNASWLEAGHWNAFCQYDQELDRTVADKKIILLCTHSLSAKRAINLNEIVRAHHFTLFCRNGSWEFPDTPELVQAEAQVTSMTDQLAKVAGSMSALSEFTPREKVVLTQIVRGASSKEIASLLAISPRTVEFHRANIMSKVGAKNVAGLVRMISEQQTAFEASTKMAQNGISFT